jgi:pantothenate kinase
LTASVRNPNQAPPPGLLLAEAVTRLRQLGRRKSRVIVAIIGEPGAGKTTFSDALAKGVGEDAVVVGMDGFHLSNTELRRLGRLRRKGAPDTFDAWGFLHVVSRIRGGEDPCVYAPAYERNVEEPIAGSVFVPASARYIIIEGNYLLLPTPPWSECVALFDEVWYLDVDQLIRRERLIRRHVQFGKLPSEAQKWAATIDEANAATVRASRDRADWWIEST